MMKIFTKKSKKGITLVESVFAVVILATLTIGIISLLTAGGTKILQISNEAGVYSQAVQKMDMVISAISNGSDEYIVTEPAVELKLDKLKNTLGLTDVTITAVPALYKDSEAATVSNFRGWYLTLSYQGVTVKGFVSNSEGVFDRA